MVIFVCVLCVPYRSSLPGRYFFYIATKNTDNDDDDVQELPIVLFVMFLFALATLFGIVGSGSSPSNFDAGGFVGTSTDSIGYEPILDGGC
jgi:hypothetical protein